QSVALPARCSAFFFQAEDGIRAPLVTGVQTCALPIWLDPRNCVSVGKRDLRRGAAELARAEAAAEAGRAHIDGWTIVGWVAQVRSEERRVGKGGVGGEGAPAGSAHGQQTTSARCVSAA